MKRTVPILCLLNLILVFANAQEATPKAVLNGIVTIQNSLTNTGKTQPLVGVQIKAGLSTSTNTISNGTFILKFILKEPGDEVFIEVSKTGMEVVNRKDQSAILRSLNDQDKLLKIYMCKEGEWEKNALLYYHINDSVISLEYNNKIAKLKMQNKASEEVITKLNKEKIYAQKVANELSEKFAQANLDESTDLFNLAFAEFKQGNRDKAIQVLDGNKLQADFISAQQQKRDGVELIKIGQNKLVSANLAIEQIISDYVFKARLFISNLQFDSAENTYQEAIKKDSDNISIIEEYANYLTYINKDNEAINLFRRALSLGVPQKDSALIYEEMGYDYLANKDRHQTYTSFKNSFDLYVELCKKDSTKYLPFVANSYVNLATVGIFMDSSALFSENIEQSERIYDTLALHDSIYYYAVANILFLKNTLLKRSNTTALGILVNALSIYEDHDALEKFSRTVDFLRKFQNKQLSNSTYLRTTDLLNQTKFGMEGFSLISPEKQIELILAIVNQSYGLGVISYINDYKEAVKNSIIGDYDTSYSFKKAVSLIKESNIALASLAKENPQTYKPLLAQSFCILGISYNYLKDTFAAINSQIESVNILKELCAINPKAYAPNLAFFQKVLAEYYFSMKNYHAGIELMKEGKKKAELSLMNDVEMHDLFLLSFVSELNNMYLDFLEKNPSSLAEFKDSAISNAQEAFILSNKYSTKVDPSVFNESNFYKTFFDNITMDSLEKLKEIDSLSENAYKYKTNGDKLVEENKSSEALVAYNKSVEYFNSIIYIKHNHKAQLRYDLSKIYFAISDLVDDSRSKLTSQRKGVDILQELITKNPDLKGELANMKGNLAYYLILEKNCSEAIIQAKEAMAIDKTKDWIYTNLALAYLFNGDFKKAKSIYIKYKNKSYKDGRKSFKKAFLSDLDKIGSKYSNDNEVDKIRRILNK